MKIEKELQENWQYLKAEVLKRWGRLAETDVENAHGNLQALNKLVSNRYGSESHFMDEIQHIYDGLKNNNSIKNSRPINAGHRDNSPDEVNSKNTDAPTINEER